MTSIAPRLMPVFFLLAVAALWETASRLGWVDARLLPPFSDVARTLAGLLAEERFREDLRLTLSEIFVAFAIVAPLGLIGGFWLGENKRAYAAFAPTLHLLLAVPKSIFLPIFIFALGIGFGQKVVYAITLAIFIVILSGVAAVQSVPAGLVTTARAFGASRAQIYRRIYLPAMEPMILEGLRMGFIFTTTGVLLAEMYGAPRGLGRLIFAWGESYRMQELLAGVMLVVTFTIAVNETIRAVEDMRKTRNRVQA